ncbi:MAG: hypothetical protein Q9167_000363 [Letrouitia subvulpina]
MRRDGPSSAADAEVVQSPSPAFQIIVLGAGGGPNENNVIGLLVRSTARPWTRDSVLAVDAGVHLASIIQIFEDHLPKATRKPGMTTTASALPTNGEAIGFPADAAKPKLFLTTGPFANLELPFESAKANATYVFRNLISTYLITHPHLDHIAGFAINTAALQQTVRRKRVAALPSTIEAIKEHIFNGVIWPNLSDEGEGAVGFVSYDRLVDGGNVALGDGEGRGYIEVCDGLAVKGWSVSHGECIKRHNHKGSYSSESTDGSFPYYSRRPSRKEPQVTIEMNRTQNYPQSPEKAAYDSAAYFLRDEHTGKEVLIFGDVEPDSVSLSPRTARVWQDAAVKISAALLTGILIECSYDNSQSDTMLFGHLTPRHLITELSVLANMVCNVSSDTTPGSPRKRKRSGNGFRTPETNSSRRSVSKHRTRRRTRSSVSPSTQMPLGMQRKDSREIASTPEEPDLRRIEEENGTASPPGLALRRSPLKQRRSSPSSPSSSSSKPLHGLQIIIIHVKDALQDGPDVGETILAQLRQHEQEAQLGCTFTLSKSGDSYWL